MMARDYNVIDWNKIFVEDSGSSTGLIWAIKPASQIRIGDTAGNIWVDKKDGRKRAVVMFKGKTWYVHRVLYIMRHGAIDNAMVVDHTDGNTLNNAENNLRLVPQLVNVRNLKQYKTNVSGKTGVYFMVNRKSNTTYVVAKCNGSNGKVKRKMFNCTKLGLLPAFADACRYRDKMISNLNSFGAGYSERHGNV